MPAIPVADVPLLVYFDATVVIDYCWDKEPRHAEAIKLIEICGRHSDKIQVHTSRWAWVETHGRIYSKLLEEKDHITWQREVRGHKWEKKDPRTYFPAKAHRLQEATEILEARYGELERTCNFHTEDPDDSYTRVMMIVNELAKQGAIYPQDSLHLAISIRLGCRLFISDDSDLLDRLKTAPCHQLVQDQLQERLLPLKALPFEALPLRTHRKQHMVSKSDVFTKLKELGYT